MADELRIKAVEMTRQIRDAHYAALKDSTPEERIEFYRKEARALHAELGIAEELPEVPDQHQIAQSATAEDSQGE